MNSIYGPVGNGLNMTITTLTIVAPSSSIRDVFSNTKIVLNSAGEYHSMALGSKDEVYTWVIMDIQDN